MDSFLIQWCTTGICAGGLLFVVYINDLDLNVAGMISKFAEDTIIGGIVANEESCLKL